MPRTITGVTQKQLIDIDSFFNNNKYKQTLGESAEEIAIILNLDFLEVSDYLEEKFMELPFFSQPTIE